jgi:peptidoglycan hydrolase-like protein with peptidoglycan-binding domain
MRKILTFGAALALAAFAWADGPTTAPAKKTATATVAKTPAKPSVPQKAAVAKHGPKAPVVRSTWRTRQTTPTADRYREIQEALVARGYLSSEEANGAWGPSSAEALKKFQAEQTLGSTGRIDSLSLIALGLGPKYDAGDLRVVDGNVQPESGRN